MFLFVWAVFGSDFFAAGGINYVVRPINLIGYTE
jgi:hypothetical protein